MQICAATNNPGKLKELRRILTAMGHEVKSLKELGIDLDPEETGTTFAENARLKAEAFCKASGLATVADDSGLCVEALGGAPGVFSARYCGRHGDDEANNDKLLAAMKDIPEEQRGAKFVSCVCLMLPDGRHLTCEGECEGEIATARKPGDYGFGYDPLFIPLMRGIPGGVGTNHEYASYAQLTPEEKDAISHRGAALDQLAEELPAFLADGSILAAVSAPAKFTPRAELTENAPNLYRPFSTQKKEKTMLTSKQRAILRGKANTMDPVFQIGKGEIDEALVQSVLDCLAARELIKLKVLENSPYSAREAAELLTEKTGADCVQVIGAKFVLYLQKKKESQYAALLK